MTEGLSEDEKRICLAVARALWRMDRSAPETRRELADRVWADAKADYVTRARKLVRGFDRDGITLLIPEAALAASE